MGLTTADSIEQQFGLAVRRLREQRRWSQERLAAEASLNRSYLGEVERGSVAPSLTTAAKLAQALQVRLADLVSQCEPSPP
jgi:transcriptional regulator with XRE-family HTH domain